MNALQALFVRACVWDGDKGRTAFAEWEAGGGDLRDPGAADRGLLALLQSSGNADGELLPVLRAAAAHEQLRTEGLHQAAADAATGLHDPVVIGGLALACTVYPSPALRHCHDVDFLVESAVAGPEPAVERHPSGTVIAVHRRLHRDRTRHVRVTDTVEIDVADRKLRALDPAGLLAVLAETAPRPGLVWAADLWFLLRSGVDWDRFLAHARQARRSARALALLDWAGRELGAHAPPEVLSGLARARRSERALDLVYGRARAALNACRARPRLRR